MPDLLERLRSALSGRYVVERELGRGGMATVYLAEDLKHRRKVAIKVLHPELAVTLAADRFLNEIQIAAGLTHPHILQIVEDCVEESDRPAIFIQQEAFVHPVEAFEFLRAF